MKRSSLYARTIIEMAGRSAPTETVSDNESSPLPSRGSRQPMLLRRAARLSHYALVCDHPNPMRPAIMGGMFQPRHYRMAFLLRHFVAKWRVGCLQSALYGCAATWLPARRRGSLMFSITEKITHLFERRLQERTDSLVNQKMQNLLHNVFYEPYMRSHDHYAFDETEGGETVCELGMPVPPQKVMRKYAATPEAYLANGKQNTLKMLEIMKAVGATLDANSAILDFGCAAARMTRWLRLLGDGREY